MFPMLAYALSFLNVSNQTSMLMKQACVLRMEKLNDLSSYSYVYMYLRGP